ncbi:SDR family NAD(P)-dependent oxidoreductase [Syntrophomonas curvata]
MFDYQGKVVAITGGASGIGKQMAMELADRGAKYFALADMRAPELKTTTEELRAKGVEVISAAFDVTDDDDFEYFAKLVFNKFGCCDFFFNNAGVSPNHVMWEMPLKDWQWVFDVNVFGVVRGINAFVPKMIASDKECYIFNTSSLAGLATFWGGGAYISSKHAVVGLTEVLELDLRHFNTKVKAYAICPGFVTSNLYRSDTYRPEGEDWMPVGPAYQTDAYQEIVARSSASAVLNMPTDEAVRNILEEFEADKFILLTHQAVGTRCLERYDRFFNKKLRPFYEQPKSMDQELAKKKA